MPASGAIAFLWNLGLLSFAEPGKVKFVLQDFDWAVQGNFTSGLLCERQSGGTHKTRICSEWLEDRGFETVITERAFDAHTKRSGDEPFIALCGFDLVVECGLGADAARFDRILFHTFPDAQKPPLELWPQNANIRPPTTTNQKLMEAFRHKDDCGILAQTLADSRPDSSRYGRVHSAFRNRGSSNTVANPLLLHPYAERFSSSESSWDTASVVSHGSGLPAFNETGTPSRSTLDCYWQVCTLDHSWHRHHLGLLPLVIFKRR